MRIVSMVPSWTETLVRAGIQVVGRTRFCIHPTPEIKSIPVIGGTKDWNLEQVRDLKPDLILLDREENPKQMYDEAPCACLVTHISSVESVAPALSEMALAMKSEYLKRLANRWQEVSLRPQLKSGEIPGVVQWLRRPVSSKTKTVYVIWQNPWMAVSCETFIGSVLHHVGIEVESHTPKYFEFKMEDLPADALLLFSTEPFPFLKKLPRTDLCAAIVDGEKYSWFGVRSLEFLEAVKPRQH